MFLSKHSFKTSVVYFQFVDFFKICIFEGVDGKTIIFIKIYLVLDLISYIPTNSYLLLFY